MHRHVAAALILSVALIAAGCAGTPRFDQQPTAVVPTASKIRNDGGVDLSKAEKIADVSAAASVLGTAPAVPADTLGRDLIGYYLVDERVAKNGHSLIIEYKGIRVTEVPFPTDAGARECMYRAVPGGFEPKFMRRVTIRGHEGVAWNRYYLPPSFDASGNAVPGWDIPYSNARFAVGNLYISVSSTDTAIDSSGLLRVAESLGR